MRSDLAMIGLHYLIPVYGAPVQIRCNISPPPGRLPAAMECCRCDGNKGSPPSLFPNGGSWDRWNFLQVANHAASEGEGAVVPKIGRVPGSREFSERYARKYGEIGNYAANSYDAALSLFSAIRQAARSMGRLPDREAVRNSMQSVSYQGIAYRDPVRWSERRDNLSAMTALHVVNNGEFRQVAED